MDHFFSMNMSIWIVVFIAFALGMLCAWFVLNVYLPIKDERRHILLEMERAESRSEYDFWKSRLILLYLKHIPVINLFARGGDDDEDL